MTHEDEVVAMVVVVVVVNGDDLKVYNGDWDACVPYTDNEAWYTET